MLLGSRYLSWLMGLVRAPWLLERYKVHREDGLVLRGEASDARNTNCMSLQSNPCRKNPLTSKERGENSFPTREKKSTKKKRQESTIVGIQGNGPRCHKKVVVHGPQDASSLSDNLQTPETELLEINDRAIKGKTEKTFDGDLE